jgi:hypothetical protein
MASAGRAFTTSLFSKRVYTFCNLCAHFECSSLSRKVAFSSYWPDQSVILRLLTCTDNVLSKDPPHNLTHVHGCLHLAREAHQFPGVSG